MTLASWKRFKEEMGKKKKCGFIARRRSYVTQAVTVILYPGPRKPSGCTTRCVNSLPQRKVLHSVTRFLLSTHSFFSFLSFGSFGIYTRCFYHTDMYSRYLKLLFHFSVLLRRLRYRFRVKRFLILVLSFLFSNFRDVYFFHIVKVWQNVYAASNAILKQAFLL